MESNYGTILKMGDGATPTEAFTAVANVIKIKPPKINHPVIESTSHGSNGVREYVKSNLVGYEEFSIEIGFVSVGGNALIDLVKGTASSNFEMEFPNGDKWAFSAHVTSFEALDRDAQSPELDKASVTFQPTGAMTITEAV